jgi:hypothetical protein
MKLPLIVAALVLGLGLSGGCAGSREIQRGMVYPEKVTRGTTLDIQVIRRSTIIEMTNTTARVFGPSVLWLNGRFSKEIPGFAVGQTLTFRLREFKDEFGESFRGGGFFATERPELLALAEIEPRGSGEMLGLIVVRGDD